MNSHIARANAVKNSSAKRATKAEILKETGRKFPRTELSEMDYTEKQQRLLKAVDAWKKRMGRKFPTVIEIIAIAESIGWSNEGGWADDAPATPESAVA